jgi:hypothetical protein
MQTEKQELKNEKNIKIAFFFISILLYIISLNLPAYSTDGGTTTDGLNALIFGWMGLIIGSGYLSWFANPLYFAALLTNSKFTKLSLILNIFALLFAIGFMGTSKIIINAAGKEGYITKLHSGFWFWMFSIIVLLFFQIFRILNNNFNKVPSKTDS